MWLIRFVYVNIYFCIDLKDYFIYFLVYFLMWYYIFSVMSVVDWYRFGLEIFFGDFRVGCCIKWGGRIMG